VVRLKAGISDAEHAAYADVEDIPLAMLGWSTGCLMIWSALFCVGNFLYGRTGYALALLAVFLVTGTVVIRVVNKLWH
jgi:hypothetical protein